MENSRVEQHYGRGDIFEAILQALRDSNKDLTRLQPADLAPVDAFHIRGREATIELARRIALQPGLTVLDVGCGLGGSSRYLAAEHQCHVTGIDLTREYVDIATALAAMVGLQDQVQYHHSSALAMPFEDCTFDVVWTEHVQMNIADKGAFYTELARVLKPGGSLLFHDIFQGPGGTPRFPVPWAEDSSLSFLALPETVRRLLIEAGLTIVDWEDKTPHSLSWFIATVEKLALSGQPPLGLHLLMGPTGRVKFANIARNLQEQRIAVLQAVLEKQ